MRERARVRSTHAANRYLTNMLLYFIVVSTTISIVRTIRDSRRANYSRGYLACNLFQYLYSFFFLFTPIQHIRAHLFFSSVRDVSANGNVSMILETVPRLVIGSEASRSGLFGVLKARRGARVISFITSAAKCGSGAQVLNYICQVVRRNHCEVSIAIAFCTCFYAMLRNVTQCFVNIIIVSVVS